MKLKIVSDGTQEGTAVVGDNGLVLENVMSVEIRITPMKIISGVITVANLELDVAANCDVAKTHLKFSSDE